MLPPFPCGSSVSKLPSVIKDDYVNSARCCNCQMVMSSNIIPAEAAQCGADPGMQSQAYMRILAGGCWATQQGAEAT